jgi:hypothetical protein
MEVNGRPFQEAPGPLSLSFEPVTLEVILANLLSNNYRLFSGGALSDGYGIERIRVDSQSSPPARYFSPSCRSFSAAAAGSGAEGPWSRAASTASVPGVAQGAVGRPPSVITTEIILPSGKCIVIPASLLC